MSSDKNFSSIPGGNSPDPLAPAENNIGIGSEIDEDQAVHSETQIPSAENEQQDPDDAVHKGYKPVPQSHEEDAEHDPDDAVHQK